MPFFRSFKQRRRADFVWAALGFVVVAGVVWTWHKSLASDDASPDRSGGADASQFLRISRDDKQNPIALQTSIARFVSTSDSGNGVVVDLIGAVHVGEESYYDELNEQFKSYDAVLYELVAPPGTRVAKGRGTSSAHPVGLLQNALKSVLGLSHQLEHIDYQAANMVHADMSPDEFAQAMENRGESFWTMFLKLLGQSLAQDAKARSDGRNSDLDIIFALFDANRSQAIKRVLAEQFADIDGAISALEGPNGSAILTDRNQAALKVLQQELDGGKRKLAVFYGAAHLPDMERRLIADFGLKRSGERWVDAWKLQGASDSK